MLLKCDGKMAGPVIIARFEHSNLVPTCGKTFLNWRVIFKAPLDSLSKNGPEDFIGLVRKVGRAKV